MMKFGPRKGFPAVNNGKKALKGHCGKVIASHRRYNQRNNFSRRPGKFINGRGRKDQDRRFMRKTTARENSNS